MVQVDPDNEPALQCFEKSGLGYLDVELPDDNESHANPDFRCMVIHHEHWQRQILSSTESAREEENNIIPRQLGPHLSAKLLASLKDLIQNN